eukprot:m.152394 g.152394  ORF g.152394 m.152394 type:complete len:739 (-) comp30805_c1_seq2:189-2405(-)
MQVILFGVLMAFGAVTCTRTSTRALDCSTPTTIWVDADNGRDTNNGCTNHTPVKSIDAAQKLARQNSERMSVVGARGVTVRLKGMFMLTESMNMTEQDAGCVWSGSWGDGSAAATFTGGVSVPPAAWKPVAVKETLMLLSEPLPPGRTLLELDLAAVIPGITPDRIGRLTRHGFTINSNNPTPMQLIGGVDGVKFVRARWPKRNQPEVAMTTVRNPNESAPMFDINTTRPLQWQRSWSSRDGVWLDGILSQNWIWTYNQVINLQNGSFSLAFPEVAPPTTNITYCCHNRFFFDNVFEELADVGEYYINTTAMTIYLVVPSKPTSHKILNNQDRTPVLPNVVVSLLEVPMVVFASGSINITLQHIFFTSGRSSAINSGSGLQIVIDHVEIGNFGLGGVQLGAQSNITNAHIHDIGTTGCNLFGSGHQATLKSGNSAVINSHIHDFGQWQKVYAPAVYLGGVANQVLHCKIENGPHAGILIDGNDNVVAFTEMTQVVLEFADLGAIYMNLGPNPLKRGTIIDSNFFHHLGSRGALVQGVYADNGSMSVKVTRNVFYQVTCGTTCNAVHGNGASYLNATNNVFVDDRAPVLFSDRMMETKLYESLLPQWKAAFSQANASGMLPIFYQRYPELRTFWSENRRMPKSNVFKSAIVYNPTVVRGATDNDVDRNMSSRGFGCEACPMSDVTSTNVWLTNKTNPGFSNVSAMNFTIDVATVRQQIPNWESIDFDSIGTTLGCVGVC